MALSKKCYYAIRAVYELVKHAGENVPLKIADISKAQNIPTRFLESILVELKGGGFVESRRGTEGGYWLARNMDDLSIGHIVEFIDGPIKPTECILGRHQKECECVGGCIYLPIWRLAHEQIADAYYGIKFRILVQQNRRAIQGASGQDYMI